MQSKYPNITVINQEKFQDDMTENVLGVSRSDAEEELEWLKMHASEYIDSTAELRTPPQLSADRMGKNFAFEVRQDEDSPDGIIMKYIGFVDT